jgi:DNA-binding transcriptional LysR family regulator
MQDGPEFRHLLAFVTVAEECHFGKAALRLHLTQPALSTQIKQLESWLGEHLFRRVPHGAELTEKGRNFLVYARRILHMRQHALKATSRRHSEAEWPLRVGYSPFIDREIIYEALTGYQEIVPEGEIYSSSDNTAKLLEMMSDGRLDAAIVTLPVLGNEIFEHRICTDRLLLCMRRDDPLAKFTEVPRQEIARRLHLLFHRDHHPPLHDMILRRFKRAGIELRPTETYSAPAEVQFLVRTRRSLGLVRDRAILDPELTVRPMMGIEIRVGTAFVCHKDQQRPAFPMLAYRMAQTRRGTGKVVLKKSPSSVSLDIQPIPIKRMG